ncbi:peroxiredoxin-like family protein [Burkholderia sp. S171]|uniref:peroxiredoxin-like family protein n=1 Tax=Burkholderia sp. S171 TaxID=1641860 RepID=UPI00131A6179|nr:peroxiredoxin-like family protein [Burkholderia sp. S171]
MIDMISELQKIRGLRDQYVPATQTCVMDRAIEDLISSEIRESSLKAGDRIPDFILPDSRGNLVNVRALLDNGPVVLSFFRGSWCPYCNIELRALQQASPQIAELGATIVAVSPEYPDMRVTPDDAIPLTFPLLFDFGNKVARLFGIVYEMPEDLLDVYRQRGHDLEIVNGSLGSNTLALPATFVIDQSRTIRLAFVDEDYSRRLAIDDILVALGKRS